MARYFFDLRDGDRMSPDDEGTELDGVEEARAQVMQALPAIAAHHIRTDGDHADFEMTVRDASGHELMRATLSYALTET
jgi:hypothetical protein